MEQIITFVGSGLNWDDNKAIMSPGDGRYRLNCIVEGDGVFGTIDKSLGNNQFVLPFSLPSGTNKIVGWCEDIEKNAGIFILYNSEGKHGIFRWILDDNSVQRIIWEGSYLNLGEHYSVDCDVIGNLLFFNDGKNEPRKLNIDRAILYTSQFAGEGIGYWYITSPEPAFVVS